MSAIIKMTEKEDVIDPDMAFGNLIASHIKMLPKRIKYACQAELNQVLFKYMIYAA